MSQPEQISQALLKELALDWFVKNKLPADDKISIAAFYGHLRRQYPELPAITVNSWKTLREVVNQVRAVTPKIVKEARSVRSSKKRMRKSTGGKSEQGSRGYEGSADDSEPTPPKTVKSKALQRELETLTTNMDPVLGETLGRVMLHEINTNTPGLSGDERLDEALKLLVGPYGRALIQFSREKLGEGWSFKDIEDHFKTYGLRASLTPAPYEPRAPDTPDTDEGVEETKDGETTPPTPSEFAGPLKTPAVTPGAARTRYLARRKLTFQSGSGASLEEEASPKPTVAANTAPADPTTKMAQDMMKEPIDVSRDEQPDVELAAADPDEDEQEDAVGQTTTESTRQNELAANETATLDYKPNFTEVMDPSLMRLATDASRGNLGAGTAAQMQSADVWGNMFSRPPPDLPGAPETFIKTDSNGMSVEEAESAETQKDVYSFLPFAKLGGVTVWIPRHVQTAKFFFTAEDYEELVSHVRDGDPLTLNKADEVDSTVMMSTIIKSYGTLKRFCELGPMLPMTASIEQVYAEWLEMRQIGRAVARYQQITGGMYENTELSMKGGIRAAVASALRPFVKAWNQMHPNPQDQISEGGEPARPSSAPMFSGKRKAEAGIVAPEEYNPQFSFQPVELKRVKFSIPSI